MRRDMAHGIGIGANGDAENHAIAAFNGARRIRFHHIRQTKFAHTFKRFRPPRGNHQSLRDIAALFRHARDGRPDQPNANQTKPIEKRFSHVAP
jgi:D-mannonate dehydratase